MSKSVAEFKKCPKEEIFVRAFGSDISCNQFPTKGKGTPKINFAWTLFLLCVFGVLENSKEAQLLGGNSWPERGLSLLDWRIYFVSAKWDVSAELSVHDFSIKGAKEALVLHWGWREHAIAQL
ncbi:hypothetical protein B0H13DRAFT_1881791 [Mycena leptocephala]|nr:hypothetical protein B0H13DRAFT_1881791 [Mycena leptocephala]